MFMLLDVYYNCVGGSYLNTKFKYKIVTSSSIYWFQNTFFCFAYIIFDMGHSYIVTLHSITLNYIAQAAGASQCAAAAAGPGPVLARLQIICVRIWKNCSR